MDIFRNWIINIITVMIVSFFVEILMPDGSFKKYSKLVLGLIVMIVIIKPIVQLSDSEALLNRMTIETANYIDRAKVTEQSEVLQQKQTQQIVSTYQNKITEQINQRVKSVSGQYDANAKVQIDTNLESSGFGSIRNIEIVLTLGSEGEYVPAITTIEPVKISENPDQYLNQTQEMNKDIDEQITKEEEQMRIKILDNLSSIYNIPRDNIKIHIQKNVK
ncbi:MAG: stage III sporulation protein AF [Clostridia bacterium]